MAPAPLSAAPDPPPAPLDSIETASRDEIEALQAERLRRTLRHAYDNVAHYRARFDALGLRPGDMDMPADIARLPFTEKEDLRAHHPFGLLAVPRRRVARFHASSGTTGRPTVIGHTGRDIESWAGLMARSIRAAGGRAGDVAHVAYGYGLFTGGLGAHYGAERLGCTVIPVSGGMTARQVRLIDDLEPDIILVTPSYMLAIADEFERRGLDPAGSSLRIGVFGAEPWSESMRREIEARFAIHAVDIYGLSEMMGPGVACECVETKDGLHLWEDHFFPEIVDPETGAPLPDGARGELVLTTLSREAMPLIRYRTRDLTRLLPGTARTMRRMERIAGRSDDMLIIRGVNLFPSQIEELILGLPTFAPHYLLEVRREGRLDALVVRVEAKPETAGDAGRRDRNAVALEHAIKSAIGITAQVRIVSPGAIERSAGKARRVIDLRPVGAGAPAPPHGETSRERQPE